MWSTLSRLWKESNQIHKLILLGFIYIILGIFSFVSSYSIGNITQNAILLNTSSIKTALSILIISSILHISIEWWANIYKSKIKQNMMADFKTKTAYSLLKSKFYFSNTLQQGDIIGRMNSDISSIVMATDFSLIIAKSIFFIIVLVISLLIMDWRLLLAFFITIPFLFLAQYWTSSKSTKNIMPWKEAMGKTNGLIQDLINNRTTIKAFRLENTVMDWTENALKESSRAGIIGIGKLYFISFLPIIFTFLPIFLLSIVGVHLVLNGSIKLDILISSFIMAQLASEEFNNLQNAMQNIPQLLASVERIFPLWDSPKEHTGNINTIEYDYNKPVIVFKNVNFSYPSDEESIKILNNLSFKIAYGEKIGIVGTSGSGKSTIFKLITGLYEQDSGDIEIFGINIKDIDKSTLRKNISMVTQNSFLFDTSIIGNLKYANKNITENKIENAISNAYLQDYVNSQSEKLNTVIGEKGNKLSGGQRQRLSIARSFARNSPLILLDEATSALDVETESKIQEKLDNISNEQTQLVIAHRFSTLVNMDRIMVLDKGTIVEEGKHEELILNNSIYTTLYNAQKGEDKYDK